jgi:hypothetical protein
MILATVAEYPGGVGISTLHDAIVARRGPINRRTLQRRLARLARDGRILGEGRSVARLYKPVTFESLLSAWKVAEPGSVYELYVPLSAEGAEVRDLVRQPQERRAPVGYDRRLLERYVPGMSQYLSDAQRHKLHRLGRTEAAGQPSGAYARANLKRFCVDLAWSSSRLEGNGYSRRDVQILLEQGRAPALGNALETQMILNHRAAIVRLVADAAVDGYEVRAFRDLHALLSQNPPHVPGDFNPKRHIWETEGQAVMPLFIEERFRLLLDKTAAIADPFEQAFFLLVQIPYLQPFMSLNKRVARLAANIPLIRHNLRPLTFIDVPELAYVEGTIGVYELRRVELLRDVFVWAYERACKR